MIVDILTPAVTLSILAIPAVANFIATEASPPEWVGSMTQVSSFGLVAWIVYYTFTKGYPAIQAAHALQLAEQRAAHAESIRLLADAHVNAVNTITASFSSSLKTQREDLLAQLNKH